ncbi:MAG: hypothetical protein M1338_03505 [Patescibacteria group bacterium]|nr:hypothetical protein [Patescibacteria group bacterium]
MLEEEAKFETAPAEDKTPENQGEELKSSEKDTEVNKQEEKASEEPVIKREYLDFSESGMNEEEQKLAEESFNNVLLRIFEKHPTIDADIIDALVKKFTVKSKETNETGAGYDDVAYFDQKNHRIILRPNLFGKNERGEFNFDFEHVIYHELSHAFTEEKGLVYDHEDKKAILIPPEKDIADQDKNDLDWLRETLEDPEKFAGTQGKWLDMRLKELAIINNAKNFAELKESVQNAYQDDDDEAKQFLYESDFAKKDFSGYQNLKKHQVVQEIIAERMASFLKSDGTENGMLKSYLERFSGKIAQEVSTEDLREFIDALTANDKEKIDILGKKYSVFQQIILENRAFHKKFQEKLADKEKIAEFKKLKKEQNREIDEEDDDEDSELYSGSFFESGSMGGVPNKGQGNDPLGWLWAILEPFNQSTAG